MYLGIVTSTFFIRTIVGQKKSFQILSYWLIFTFFFLFAAFRYEVGCDWFGYELQISQFDWVQLSELASMREPLWVGLILWMRQYDIQYFWINVISSVIFFFGVHMLARHQPNRLAFIVLLFPVLIINMPMSGIKQATAIGIMCIAYIGFMRQKLSWYIISVIVASMVHSSSVIFALLVPFVRKKFSSKNLLYGLILIFPGLGLLSSTSSFQILVVRYFTNPLGDEAAGAVYRTGILALTAAHFFIFLRRPWNKFFPSDYSLATLGSLLMFLPLLLVPFSGVAADRVAYFLIPIQAVVFARIPYLKLRYNKALHIFYPYLALLFLFIVWISFSSLFDQCYRPYRNLLI